MPFPAYRYVLADLLTDTNVANLPLTGVSFTRAISRAGAFQGTWNIGNRKQAQMAEYIAERVGRLALWCYRGAELWWGGPLWTMSPSRNARGAGGVSFQAATFESYADHRKIRQTLSYTDEDQTTIMAELWDHLQSYPHGDIGVITQPSPSGILRSATYLGDGSASYEKKIEELGDLSGGVEHTIDVVQQGSERLKLWRTGNPRLAEDLPIRIFVNGTRIPSYSRTIDATRAATSFQTRGRDGLLTNPLEAEDLIAAGWPQLDMFTDRSTITDLSTLQEYNLADRDRFAGHAVVPTYEAYIDNSGWNPNRIGEVIRVKHAADDWFRPGVVEDVRPVSVTVSVPDRNDKRESMKFTVDETAIGAEV